MGKKLTTQEFIAKAKVVHGDKYDYSKSIYINSRSKISISCKLHGEFWQVANSHLSGEGCSKCRYMKNSISSRMSPEKFLERCGEIHNNLYNYSNTSYIKATLPVKIICNIHGEFEQMPFHHLNGSGCKLCNGGGSQFTTKEFIIRAKEVHGNLYNYSAVDYKEKDSYIIIICKDHGEFLQKAHDHINGCGCPFCRASKAQRKLYNDFTSYFKEINIVWEHSPKWLGRQRFDMYLFDYNIAIEYNGEQHYYPVDIYGGENGFYNTIERDQRKRQKCIDNNCILFELKYDYNENDYNEVVNKITSIINNQNKKENEIRK